MAQQPIGDHGLSIITAGIDPAELNQRKAGKKPQLVGGDVTPELVASVKQYDLVMTRRSNRPFNRSGNPGDNSVSTFSSLNGVQDANEMAFWDSVAIIGSANGEAHIHRNKATDLSETFPLVVEGARSYVYNSPVAASPGDHLIARLPTSDEAQTLASRRRTKCIYPVPEPFRLSFLNWRKMSEQLHTASLSGQSVFGSKNFCKDMWGHVMMSTKEVVFQGLVMILMTWSAASPNRSIVEMTRDLKADSTSMGIIDHAAKALGLVKGSESDYTKIMDSLMEYMTKSQQVPGLTLSGPTGQALATASKNGMASLVMALGRVRQSVARRVFMRIVSPASGDAPTLVHGSLVSPVV